MPDAPLRAFEFVDLVVILALVFLLGGMLLNFHRRNGGVLSSISRTVGATKRTQWTFTAVMSVLYPLYYAWLWFWVGPLFAMPSAYYILLGAAVCFETIFVWVPATSGWRRKTHEIAAGFVGVVMASIPALILLAAQQDVSPTGEVTLVTFYVILGTMLVLLIRPKYRKHTFTYEVIYCAIFMLALSVAGHS